MGRIGNIIQRKNKQDAKKASIFTKLARNITVAVKEGGADPNYNSSLVSAIDKAKMANMPNENIERAIKKGSGDGNSDDYFEITYEGYAPGGVAVLVECLTDNINRTAADIRSYFVKANGNLGTTGCVSYMFDHLGVFVVEKTKEIDEDEFMLEAIEKGADDFIVEKEHYEIYTKVSDFGAIRDYLKKENYNLKMAELRYVPQNFVSIKTNEEKKDIQKLIDLLEEHDDVQNVYYNWNED